MVACYALTPPPASGNNKRITGFSLVELSIVLVILGLLVGGVLAGQSLIRAAELRSVTTEYQKYVAAFGTFKDKYMARPGDMANATTFWGTATCPGIAANARTSQATCNGDGNGAITHLTSGNVSNEQYGIWQHLANAGLIEGQYTGVTTSSGNYYDTGFAIGSNLPKSRLGLAGWYVVSVGSQTAANTFYVEGDYGNILAVGEVGNVNLNGSILRPEEAYNIDTKIDDGKPGSGNAVIFENSINCYLLSDGSAGASSNSAARTDITYNLQSKSVACSLIFKNVL